MEEKLLEEPIYFEYEDNKKLIYSYPYLSIWQCELGESLGRFVADTIENPAPDFMTLIKSGKANWTTELMSYLFYKEGDENIAWEPKYANEILALLRKPKNKKQYKIFKEVARDFFYNIGESWIISLLLPDKLKQIKMQNTSKILGSMLANISENKMNLFNGGSESKTSIMTEKSKKE